MKFFVPGFRDRRETSEDAWLTVRGWLADNGMPTTRRRIQALVAEIDGADHFIAVGHEEPFGGELTLLILESVRPDLIHICTLSHGLDDTRPGRSPSTRGGGSWILSRGCASMREDRRSAIRKALARHRWAPAQNLDLPLRRRAAREEDDGIRG